MLTGSRIAQLLNRIHRVVNVFAGRIGDHLTSDRHAQLSAAPLLPACRQDPPGADTIKELVLITPHVRVLWSVGGRTSPL